jgi:hypothetical protein
MIAKHCNPAKLLARHGLDAAFHALTNGRVQGGHHADLI